MTTTTMTADLNTTNAAADRARRVALADAATDRARAKHDALTIARHAACDAVRAALDAYLAAGGSAVYTAATESAWAAFQRARADEKVVEIATNRAWGHLNAAWKRRDAARLA